MHEGIISTGHYCVFLELELSQSFIVEIELLQQRAAHVCWQPLPRPVMHMSTRHVVYSKHTRYA